MINKIIVLFILTFSCNAFAQDKSLKGLTDIFITFAKASCRPDDLPTVLEPPLTDEELEEVVECLINGYIDETHRYEVLARNNRFAGSLTGLAMACTRAVGIQCSNSFIKAALFNYNTDTTIILTEGGNYNLQAGKLYVIKPNLKTPISVNIKDHLTRVFYLPSPLIKCSDFEIYPNCHTITSAY